MTLQYIDKHQDVFFIKINKESYRFTRIQLYGNKFLPLKRYVKGSTLGWYTQGVFVSYNQIRNTIKNKL